MIVIDFVTVISSRSCNIELWAKKNPKVEPNRSADQMKPNAPTVVEYCLMIVQCRSLKSFHHWFIRSTHNGCVSICSLARESVCGVHGKDLAHYTPGHRGRNFRRHNYILALSSWHHFKTSRKSTTGRTNNFRCYTGYKFVSLNHTNFSRGTSSRTVGCCCS